MYSKTTDSDFLPYGAITSAHSIGKNYIRREFTIYDDLTTSLNSFDEDVYIEPMEGMALLRIVRANPQTDSMKSFALHRVIRINKGCWFALVPMSKYAIYNLYTSRNPVRSTYVLPSPIPFNHIVPSFSIKEILAYYYVVKRPGYRFAGEVHRYYELTYVDHGSLATTVDKQAFNIRASQCMIYGPGQFHDQRVTSNDACSYLTVIFEAGGNIPEHLLNHVFTCSRKAVTFINDFVNGSDSKSPYRSDLMLFALNVLLITVLDESTSAHALPKPTSPINQHFENRLVEEIIEYITHHLDEPLPIEQICVRFSISRSTLQNLFKNNLKIAPKQYINNAKLHLSRTMIRKGDMTISEIAEKLGFSSIHYFSRKFTASYGITPSEFARQIYNS
ncbi:MAG: AraC family transcriptional regulator [Bulleidia sp.]